MPTFPVAFAALDHETPQNRDLILRVYGNISIENPDVTLEMVVAAVRKIRAAEIVDAGLGAV